MCALLFSLFSNDIPGHDSLGQEPEFSIKNSRVLWFRFDVIYVSLKKQVAWKINSCNAKKKNDVPRLLSVIVTTSYAHEMVQ